MRAWFWTIVTLGSLVLAMPGAAVEQGKPGRPPDVRVGMVGIKRFAVAGPVVGSQETIGVVELTRPAPASGSGIIVTLRSSGLASPPPTVTVLPGKSDQSFAVRTSSVAEPKTVTISAQVGPDTKTVSLTIIPPSLTLFTCNPTSVPIGASTTCTAWLNGIAATDTTVLISSPEYADQIRPFVKVYAGHRNGSFPVFGINPGPQPRTVTVNAAYAGVGKSVQLTVGPAYLKDLIVSENTTQPLGRWFDAHLQLHAPAPPGGLKIRGWSAPSIIGNTPLMSGNWPSQVPAGTDSLWFLLNAKPVVADTLVNVAVIAEFQGGTETKNTTLTVRSARLFGFYLNATFVPASYPTNLTLQHVPIGGTRISVYVELDSNTAAIPVQIALSYSPTWCVTGPPVVEIPKHDRAWFGHFTVYPCQGTTRIRATYLGKWKEATVTQTP